MKTLPRLILLALPMLFASSTLAQHQTFHADTKASQVNFSLKGSGHSVSGTFRVQSGSIHFDPSAGKISGSVVVAAGSGKTGNESRDKKMDTQVLDVAQFTEMSFVPQSYSGTLSPAGDSTIQVAGTFTLHGTPHPLTVPMQIHIQSANCTAKAQFAVPYVEWGLKDPSVFILKVAKEVQVNLTLVGRLSPESE